MRSPTKEELWDLRPKYEIGREGLNGGFSMRTRGYFKLFFTRKSRGRYHVFNRSFGRPSGDDNQGIRFVVARFRKAITIVDEDAPLSKYFGREFLKIGAQYNMDVDERRLYSFDIRLEDPVTKQTVYACTDVPIYDVLSIDFTKVPRQKSRLLAYKLTLHKRG